MSLPDDPEISLDGDRASSSPSPAQDQPLPEEWDDDDDLILWMLSLTPTQRLQVAQGFVDSVRALRHGRHSEQANRDKDRATLPILRRTLKLRNEGAGG